MEGTNETLCMDHLRLELPGTAGTVFVALSTKGNSMCNTKSSIWQAGGVKLLDWPLGALEKAPHPNMGRDQSGGPSIDFPGRGLLSGCESAWQTDKGEALA